MTHSIRTKFNRFIVRLGFERDWYLIGLGAVVGTLTGLGAVGFAALLHVFEKEVHDGQESLSIWLLFLFPVIGMGATGVLVHFFAPEARGHGVPQVMKALIKKGGAIPLRIGIVKTIASILTVGSGGSAGTEGPIVQIGATAGSVIGRRIGVPREHLPTLVGCGAAAGISSIFNAPIAGVFFVLEILLRDFSSRTFTPIVVASVFSLVTTQALLGDNQAIFPVSEQLHGLQFLPRELPSFFLLGIVCGLIAVSFNRTLHFGEDAYDRIRLHPLLKPITGALILGVMGTAWVFTARSLEIHHDPVQPAFFGNGYGAIMKLLDPAAYGMEGSIAVLVPALFILLAFKIGATTVTLASGGSGGVFAPSLFLGAVGGAAVGSTLQHFNLLPANVTPASYALVGMAAVVAASTHAPLTAILILFEMTRNVYVVLPIMLAAVTATVVARRIEGDSIYTMKLRREGMLLSSGRDLTVMRKIPVASCQLGPLPPEPIFLSDPLSKLITMHAHHHVPDFPIVDQVTGHYTGMVVGSDLRTALIDREAIPLLLVAEMVRTDLPTVLRDETLDTVLDKFAEHDVDSLCVVSPIDERLPIGVITRGAVMRRYREALEEH
jgi:CIC family chloride channel protein